MIFNTWIIGDNVLQDLAQTWDAIKLKSTEKNASYKPYLMQYYNVVNMYKITSGVSKAVARILNALIETINAEQKLPRFLVVIPDKDLLSDINVFDGYAACAITNSVDWLVKQIHVVISRKKSELMVKRPGQSSLETQRSSLSTCSGIMKGMFLAAN